MDRTFDGTGAGRPAAYLPPIERALACLAFPLLGFGVAIAASWSLPTAIVERGGLKLLVGLLVAIPALATATLWQSRGRSAGSTALWSALSAAATVTILLLLGFALLVYVSVLHPMPPGD